MTSRDSSTSPGRRATSRRSSRAVRSLIRSRPNSSTASTGSHARRRPTRTISPVTGGYALLLSHRTTTSATWPICCPAWLSTGLPISPAMLTSSLRTCRSVVSRSTCCSYRARSADTDGTERLSAMISPWCPLPPRHSRTHSPLSRHPVVPGFIVTRNIEDVPGCDPGPGGFRFRGEPRWLRGSPRRRQMTNVPGPPGPAPALA